MRAEAFAPGTWGELVQGPLPNGRRVLLGLPSRVGSQAVVRLGPRRRGQPSVLVSPGRAKARRAVELLLGELGADLQVQLSLSSVLPLGVGRASSSADILASLRATCRGLRVRVSSSRLCTLAARVEPTNPTLVPGACWFAPDHGVVLGRGRMPALQVRDLGHGRAVDTVSLADRHAPWPRWARTEFSRVVDAAQLALSTGSPTLLAAASTRSALLRAELDDRSDLHLAWARAKAEGAIGIAASHSGTNVVALYHGGARA